MLKISSLKKLVTDSMAIDLGTASTIIAVKGQQAVVRQIRDVGPGAIMARKWDRVVALFPVEACAGAGIPGARVPVDFLDRIFGGW